MVIAREHGFENWPRFAQQITTPEGKDSATATWTVWKSAQDAVVVGDVETLERLIREHQQVFRTERPQSSWLGGLTPDFSAREAGSIIAQNHCFKNWGQFAAHAAALKDTKSAVARFERAVDAIVAGRGPHSQEDAARPSKSDSSSVNAQASLDASAPYRRQRS
jgi:hypothetical protein